MSKYCFDFVLTIALSVLQLVCVDTHGASDKYHIWTAGPYKENRDYANFKMVSLGKIDRYYLKTSV